MNESYMRKKLLDQSKHIKSAILGEMDSGRLKWADCLIEKNNRKTPLITGRLIGVALNRWPLSRGSTVFAL